MIEVKFHEEGTIEDILKAYVVVFAKYKNKWILVRNRERSTWEIPGGRRECMEPIDEAAARELFEETGSRKFRLFLVSSYSVKENNIESFGEIFYAEVEELGPLPDFEIAEVCFVDSLPKNLTYPLIQPYIFDTVVSYKLPLRGNKGKAYYSRTFLFLEGIIQKVETKEVSDEKYEK